jgi:hypothetical protein
VVRRPFNHYSLLRSVERNFHLPYLGYAASDTLSAFGFNVLNHPAC